MLPLAPWLLLVCFAIVPSPVVSPLPLHELPAFCSYLSCEIDGDRKASVRYYQPLWSGGMSGQFDFRTWNWTELHEMPVTDGAPLEVNFSGLDVMEIDSLYGYERITSLILDENQISKLERESFENFKRLTKLSLRQNAITELKVLLHRNNELQYLDLSHNQITRLDAFKEHPLLSWPRLTHLNLSFNRIETITHQLSKLEQLVWLDLSNNQIHRDGGNPMILPNNLRELAMNSNRLTDWPFDSIPPSVSHLSMCCNELQTLKPAMGVQWLDLSHNSLAHMETDTFPAVEELNISSNYFDSLPFLSNSSDSWPLKRLICNRMPNLRAIDKNFIAKAANLVELEITICPKLTSLEPELFMGLKALERLDLSYNGFQQVPEQLVHWNRIKHGVNLQGNPFNCKCSLQWMLDKLIPEMKRNRELHHLFPHLRCARPAIFQGQLLVHLTAYDNALCKSTRELIGMEHVITVADTSEFWLAVQKTILVVLIVCIVIVACYLVYLKRKPRYTVIPKNIWNYKSGT
ncbi:leucine-rich repeat neuronal protein 1-like [Anopheles aquasalis]|uniref:leucine-rich repeat neuronal protein 1-like n=1 Tax=Anopheles aquasalis TaxID=42839 RepID=UPI00215B403A|nr:leucine-rich repeat neuronal protein 1-like [Anopheles aquasalis]